MSEKIALIADVTGRDGAHLTEVLLTKGCVVHGIKRRTSWFNTGRVDRLYQDPHLPGVRFFVHFGDLTDATNLIRIVQESEPDEIYNLADQSHVQVSFETAEYTANADGLGRCTRGSPKPTPGMSHRNRAPNMNAHKRVSGNGAGSKP